MTGPPFPISGGAQGAERWPCQPLGRGPFVRGGSILLQLFLGPLVHIHIRRQTQNYLRISCNSSLQGKKQPNLMMKFKQKLKLSYYMLHSALSAFIHRIFLFTQVHCCYIKPNGCELLEILDVTN